MTATAVVFLATACSSPENKPADTLPLPIAYPRLPLPETDSSVTYTGLPIDINVNAAACITDVPDATTPGITVTYPQTGTQVYYTYIPAPTPAYAMEVTDARMERIHLNLNGARATSTTMTGDSDTQGLLVRTTSPCQTPVQLLVSGPGYVLTATAFVAAGGPYDSIRPLYDLLEHDMLRSVNHLCAP